MANFDIFTGVELEEGTSTTLKKMCLNCDSCILNDDGTYACRNEAVMNIGREKILAAVPEGYEIDSLTLKPMFLKNPTKKCGNYKADIDYLVEKVKAIYE